jgi:hypothetical protein
MTFRQWLRWILFRDAGETVLVLDYKRALQTDVYVHEGSKVIFKGRIDQITLQKSGGAWYSPTTLELKVTEEIDVTRI